MAKRRLLISYAHPDDESFGSGGIIAKYVNEGAEVYLICATNGDVGTIPDEMEGQYAQVRDLRLAELDCANAVLGFKEVFLLNYKDSGMMGSATSEDPDCLWASWQDDPQAVTRRVVEIIREIKPHVIVTFNKYGGYGHPDHIAIQRATTDAFQLAGDTDYHTDGQVAYQPQRLYYSSFPTLFLRVALLWWRLRGRDVRRMGVNEDIDFQAIIDHVEPTHARVNVADYLETWDEASACHKSQGGGGTFNRFPMWLRRVLSGTQGFTRVFPVPAHNRVDERDLFQNVNADEKVRERIL